MGISAYHLLKKNYSDFFRRSFKIGLTMGIISTFLVIAVGHFQGQHLIHSQPMKMAAAEALWETADPAPLSLFSLVDQEHRTNTFEIEIPLLGSFLSHNSFSGEVKGIKDVQAEYENAHGPGNYIPPVAAVFWSFRLMVGGRLLDGF